MISIGLLYKKKSAATDVPLLHHELGNIETMVLRLDRQQKTDANEKTSMKNLKTQGTRTDGRTDDETGKVT